MSVWFLPSPLVYIPRPFNAYFFKSTFESQELYITTKESVWGAPAIQTLPEKCQCLTAISIQEITRKLQEIIFQLLVGWYKNK